MKKKQFRKHAASTFALCAALALSLTACQKSPDSSIVVNKDLDKLIEQAETPDDKKKSEDVLREENKYDSYITTIEDESLGVKVNVNAKVDMPEAEKMSVLRVSQQKITQELLDKVRKELLGDAVLYDGSALWQRTKSEIEEDMKLPKRDLEEFEKDSDAYRYAQERLDELEEAYNHALTDISFENRESDGKFQIIAEKHNADPSEELYEWLSNIVPEGSAFYGVTDGNDGTYANLYAMNSESRGNYISFRKGPNGYEGLTMEGFIPIPENAYEGWIKPMKEAEVTLTLEEATDIADKFLEKTGINNDTTEFRHCEGELISEIVRIGKKSDFQKGNSREYYVLTYMRYIDGAFITAGGQEKGFEGEKNGEYKKLSWPTEKIEFRINDSGIVGFDYHAPLSVTETVVDRSTMKSFKEIRDIFEKMIVITKAVDQAKVWMNIDRVKLGYALVSEPDSFDTGLLVPVWDFFGVVKMSGFESINEPCLTINAIDGSIVDRTLGY